MAASAAVEEPFSIRGYVAGMRAAGAGKCWPFGGEAGALPKMEVRRFRWWADEARAAPAEEEEGEEGRMAAKRRKRSILDLFAAVPQVTGGGEGLGRGKRRRRRRRRMGEEEEEGKGKEKVVLRVKRKKGFKKERVQIEIGLRKKEKSRNKKITSLSISQMFQDAIRKRKLRKALSKKKKNPKVTVLLGKESVKASQKSVLDSPKDIINRCQVQRIFKKKLKTGMERLPNSTDARSPLQSSRKSQKHVTFSGEDDVFGWTASPPEDNTEQSQLVQMFQHQNLFQDGKSQESENPHSTSVIVENDTETISEKVESIGACHTVSLTEPKDRPILGDSVDLNHCIEVSNSSNCFSAVLSSPVPPQNFDDAGSHQKEHSNLHDGCHAEENSHMAPQGPSLPISLTTEASSDVIRSPLSQPSSSCLVANFKVDDRNRSSLLGENFVAHCHITEAHPGLLRSGRDVVSSISSSTGSNKSTDAQTTDCVSACRNMYFNDDYVGLPLNSQGEFVKVYPGGTVNPNEIFKRQCLGEGSSGHLACSDFIRPKTGIDYAGLRINHHAPPFYTVGNFGFHPEPHFTPRMPAMYGIGFTRLPGFERMEVQNHGIHRNMYPCAIQNKCPMKCFCSGCMGQNSQPQKLLEKQSFFPSHDYEQNIRPAVETTVRLMGKTVTLGTNNKQCKGLDNETSCSSKQIGAGDHYFQSICTKALPQLPHGGLVNRERFGTSNGGVQPPENPSHFSSIPPVELRFGLDSNSFRMNTHRQQHQLAVPSKPPMQPVTRYSEVELGHQRSFLATQIQNDAEHMLLSSTHCRHTQSVATVSTSNTRNSYKNIVQTRPAPCQSTYPPQQFCNMTQRNPISCFLSGYAAQNTPGLMTRSEFTSSLPPLPPSTMASHVCNSANAQPHGSTTVHYPSISSVHPTGKSNTPGDATYKDKSKKWTVTRSNLKDFQMNRSCKRPAEKEVFFQLPKKPCIAIGKELNIFAVPEKGLELCGSRPEAQTRERPVCRSKEPEVDVQLVDNNTHGCSVNQVRSGPVKLKAGAKHLLQPSASMDQENSWPMHSTIPFAVENDACAVATSKKRAAEIYRF